MRSAFLVGDEQEAAQKSQVRPHDQHFAEGNRDYDQVWRSKHAIVFARSASAGGPYLYFAWSLVPVQGQEFRDRLLRETSSLDEAITFAAKHEDIA